MQFIIHVKKVDHTTPLQYQTYRPSTTSARNPISNKVDLDIDLSFLGAVATVVACSLQWLLSVKGATAAVAAAALRLAFSVIVHVYMMICMIHI
jgi:hypothetical protein